MNFESYVAGVGPEGVNDVYEIKILICYLLDKVNSPFSSEELNTIFQNCSSVNYFALATTISELKKTGHIKEIESENGMAFELLDLGRETSHQLNSILPAALRDKVVRAARNLLANRMLERARDAEIKKVNDGFIVSCTIHDIGTDLLRIELFAPDNITAVQIKTEFLSNTGNIYKGLVGILTKNKQAVEDIINEE